MTTKEFKMSTISEAILEKDNFINRYVWNELGLRDPRIYFKSKARTEKIISDLFGCKKMLMMYGIKHDFLIPHSLVEDVELALDKEIYQRQVDSE